MTLDDNRMVGNSFRLGFRFQRYWDTSMANAFFAAETGTGLFMVSLYFDFLLGMIAGLAFVGTLKPYFHLSHMGVPSKAIRALLRPDRSWISRGALGIGALLAFGVLHILNQSYDVFTLFGLPQWLASAAKYGAVVGGLIVMCYQGMAMADSPAIALWKSPLLPVSSFLYASTCGVILTAVLGWHHFPTEQVSQLLNLGVVLLVSTLIVVALILITANKRSKGGAYSVELLLKMGYSKWFKGLVLITGLLLPALMLFFAGDMFLAAVIASLALLAGFYAFRVLLFKAGVFEPLSNDLVNSLGL